MTTVRSTIPEVLRPEVDAAIDWYNASQTETFQVTGIVDADDTISSDGPRELRLVLCGGDICEQRSFRVASGTAGFEISLAPAIDAAEAEHDELDPPPGARRSWLDSVVEKHAFVVLLFYRGFW
jgi:hypothetical protein